MFKRKDLLLFLLIFISVFIIFFHLFTLDKAFLSGDHREQQYPWAKFYQEQIRQGSLPWWTNAIHCGFPLLAEGQIGAFYPLNFLFFLLLPAKMAYNYIILFQYLLGGFLFFWYLKRQKISSEAAFFASLVYLFSSTQGGYFYYNYISQKVVIWLPLTLMLVDNLFDRRRLKDVFLLGMVFAVQVFGGYLQVAVYSVLYTSLYFIYFWYLGKTKKGPLISYAAAGAIGILLSLPQLIPTYELSLLSSRANAPEEIAYIGSMNPFGILTLIYPAWDAFLGSEFYLGILGLLFMLLSFRIKKDTKKNFFVFSFFVFLLLALGKFSPLYTSIIKLTHFHSFRTPIKFLFFTAFSGAILSAYGFDHYFKGTKQKITGLKYRWVSLLCGVLAIFPVVLREFLFRLKGTLLPMLQDFVVRTVYAKPGHPLTLEGYKDKCASFYDMTLFMMSFENQYFYKPWFILIISLVLILLLLYKRRKGTVWIGACCLILFLDLYIYGYTSIKQSYEPYSSIDSPSARTAIVEYLKKDPAQFRVMEIYENPEANGRFPVFPSSNMLDHIDDLGAYSPLVMKKYEDYLSGWGYTNDSLQVNWMNPESVLSHTKELGLLNVKYVLSLEPLRHPDLSFLFEDKGVNLYENNKAMPRAYFLPGFKKIDSLSAIDPKQVVKAEITQYAAQSVSIALNAPDDGLLILSDIAYPGWNAYADGKRVAIQKVDGLFRSVALSRGAHEVTMKYEPVLYRRLAMLSGFLFIGGLVLILFPRTAPLQSARKRKK